MIITTMIISADTDQIYNAQEIIIGSNCSSYFRGGLIFSTKVKYLPREIYNIIAIESLAIFSVERGLIISNIIINLRNITSIFVSNLPNVTISREILKLSNIVSFTYGGEEGTKTIWCKKKGHVKSMMEITTILK